MKNIKTFVAGLLTGVLILGFSNTISAGSLLKKIEAYIVDQPIVVNGEQAKLKNPVLTYNNTRYVNLRDLSTLLGSDIKYSNGVIKLTNESNDNNVTEDNQAGSNQTTDSDSNVSNNTASVIVKEKYSKYGFDEVYPYNDKEYIRVVDIQAKLKDSLCFVLDSNSKTLYLTKDGQNKEVIIDDIPYLLINLAASIEYSYYAENILPLID